MRPLIKVGDQWLWLWIAVEPERRKILAMTISRLRNGLVARSMLKDLRRRYGRDKGDHRRRSVVSLGLEHEVVSGGIRNYVERLIETINGQDQSLRRLPSVQVLRSNAAWNFLRLYVIYHHYVRTHQGRGEAP